MEWAEAAWARAQPSAGSVDLSGRNLTVVLLLTGLAVAVPPLWRMLRILVTLVHELGHAGVGVLVGRRFTGFVLRGDMSGHAVTVGPARGAGRVATTWAGYPAPAVVGAAVLWLAVQGWAAPVLTGILAVLVAAALRVRSLLTALVVALVGLVAGALWWQRDETLQAQVVLGVGLLLLVGSWRHLGAVLRARGDGTSDPAVLARLTAVPRVVWDATFVLVGAGATWLVAVTLLGAAGAVTP